MEMKVDSDEVIVEIPGNDSKKYISGNHPNTEDVHLHHDPDSGLRSRKKLPAFTAEAETSRSQQQVEDDTSPLKTKSSFIQPAIPSNKETENIDKVSVTAPPFELLESPKAASPVTPRTPLMASPGQANDDDDDEIVHYHRQKRPKKIKVLVIIEFCLFVCIILVLVLSTTINKLEDKEIWSLEVWKWCGLGLSLFCGRLFSEWLMNILVFLIEKNFLLGKKVMYTLYSAQNSFRFFIWLGLILPTWVLLINRGVSRSSDTDKVLNYITRGIASTLVVAGAWILRTIVVKLLYASVYEKISGYVGRDDIFHEYILQSLSRPLDHVQNNRNTLDKYQCEDLKNQYDQNYRTITSEWEAKAVATLIFRNVAKPGYNYIEEEDLLRFMNKHEVDVVLPLIGGEVDIQRIKKKSVLNWVVSIYMNRKLLVRSINDRKEAIKKLNKFITGLMVVVLIILWVMLMGIVTTEVLLFISSQFLLAIFTFGSSAKSTFEDMIFVFVKHPFDVGDHCVIDGVRVVVEEVSILTTVFLRYDNEKIYYPNSILATKCISNFYRSPDMVDTVEFDLDVSTSVENISTLKAKIKTYIDSNPHLWQPKHSIQVREIEDINKMKMRLYITHTMNFQDYEEKSDRRSNLLLELRNIFQQLGIKFQILFPTCSD